MTTLGYGLMPSLSDFSAAVDARGHKDTYTYGCDVGSGADRALTRAAGPGLKLATAVQVHEEHVVWVFDSHQLYHVVAALLTDAKAWEAAQAPRKPRGQDTSRVVAQTILSSLNFVWE